MLMSKHDFTENVFKGNLKDLKDKDVRSSMMLVNIKLFTSTSQIKVFVFHRMICINLNSTNQPNVNGGVVTMNPKWQVMVLNPCIRTRNNI